MAKEIERKFLVTGSSWKGRRPGRRIRQGYLSSEPARVVRVRTDGRKAFLTVKGPNIGAARDEFEYRIPLQDARSLLDDLCERPLIEKTRYRVPFGGLVWEVDVFTGENRGLVVAEIELEREEQAVRMPPWVGPEVTGDPRYFNANLARNPYTRW
jgi:adenylate cyclase